MSGSNRFDGTLDYITCNEKYDYRGSVYGGSDDRGSCSEAGASVHRDRIVAGILQAGKEQAGKGNMTQGKLCLGIEPPHTLLSSGAFFPPWDSVYGDSLK